VTALGDGRLASASDDKTVRVWDASSGVCLRVLEGHTEKMQSVTALGDGRLASASDDKTVRVWGASSDSCLRALEGHAGSVTSMSFLDDGRLASASSDKKVRVWDASSGVCLRVLEGHTSDVNSVTALGDGRLASASDDCTVRVWDASSGVCLRVLKGHTRPVSSVAALGDGRLASASGGFDMSWGSNDDDDNTVRVWDALSGVCLRVLEGHTDWVVSVLALRDGRVMSASSDKTVRVWDASSGVCLETVPRDSPRAAELIASVLPGSNVSASAHCGRTRAHFSPWGSRPVSLGADVFTAQLLSRPDGRRVAAAGLRNGRVHFFELVHAPDEDGRAGAT
jgi:WD40 repeat protein